MKKNGIVLFVFVFLIAGLIVSCDGGGGDAESANQNFEIVNFLAMVLFI